MNKWEAIGGAVCFIAFFYFLGGGAGDNQAMKQVEETKRIVSCNKLKEAAIAAKASEPTCAH